MIKSTLVPIGDIYSTNFPGANENPLSLGGTWSKLASSWQAVRKVSNIAKPAAYTEAFDDAHSLYRGRQYTDCEAIGTIFRQNSSAGEIELLLRAADTSSTIAAYEFLFNLDDACEIVRWNGAFQDFTSLASGSGTGTLATGHQIRATAVSSTLTMYHRTSSASSWNQILQTTDTTLTSGYVGMAFYVHAAGGNIDDYGFSDFQVRPL